MSNSQKSWKVSNGSRHFPRNGQWFTTLNQLPSFTRSKAKKRNDQAQEESANKTRTGASQVSLEAVNRPPAVVHTLSQIDTNRHLQKDRQHLDVVEEPRAVVYSDTDQGPSQIVEEPPFSTTVNIEDLEADDIVIAVMGPTGSGKSTFIRLASGRDTQGIGHSLKSFTSHVQAIKFWNQETGRHVVLVDTPGFDDTYKSDLDVLNMISDWLASSYKRQKLLSGILYLHRITDNRMAGTPLKNLKVFRKLCGKDALDKVYLTTTMWDEVDASVGERRLDELKKDFWKTMIIQGAHVTCCRGDDDSPKQIIREILHQETTRKVLLLQEEVADLKKEVKDTQAGKELYSQLEHLVERQMELLQRIDKERKAASEESMVAALQEEYNVLQAQVDDKLRQMQELKSSPSWRKRISRYMRRK